MTTYSMDLSANTTQTARFQSTATGPALKAEMVQRVHAATQRGSGDTSNPLHSVSAYTGYSEQDIIISAHTDASGWQFTK